MLFFFAIISSSVFSDTISVIYKNDNGSVIKAITTSAKKCGFIENSEGNIFEIYSPKYFCWTKIVVDSMGGQKTKLTFKSFYKIPATVLSSEVITENKDFKRIFYQAIDQELLKDSSFFTGNPFKAKNKVLFSALNWISPSFGCYYLYDSPVFPIRKKYLIFAITCPIDFLGFWSVTHPDFDLSYTPDPNRKKNNYGIFLGAFLLIGWRCCFQFGLNNIFEYQADLEKSQYHFSYKLKF